MTSAQTSTLPPATSETIFVKFQPESHETERLDLIAHQYSGELVRWLPQIDTAIVRVASMTARNLLQPVGGMPSASPEPHASPESSMADSSAEEAAGAISRLLSFFMRLFGILTEGAETAPAAPPSVDAPALHRVLHVEADGIVEGCGEEPQITTTVPPADINDPDLSNAYGLDQIRARQSWPKSTGSGCTVAVIDTGIDSNHPEFAGRILPGFNYISDTDDTQDDNGHGTHVSGIIGAAHNNGNGAAGAAPECNLLPVKVLDNNNLGSWSDVVSGILFAVDAGADIINLSLGASASPPAAVREAIEVAVASAVVVAAAGNAATDMRFYPASYDGVVAVAAINQNQQRWAPSNYGPWIKIAAPGENIYSTALGSGYEYRSGTSMASGFVSGTCALIHELGIHDPAEIIARLMDSADALTAGDATNRQLGSGQVDALGAVDGEKKIFFPFVAG